MRTKAHHTEEERVQATFEIHMGELTWFNVTRPGQEELEEVEKRYHFLPLDVQNCLPPLQRPKVEVRPGYIFLVLLFPVFDRRTREIHPAEVDFFVGKDVLVTVHTGQLPEIGALFEECVRSDSETRARVEGTTVTLLYELISVLVAREHPMLVHLGQDIDEVEEQVLGNHRKDTISEFLRLKTSVVNFRMATQGHKRTIEKFLIHAQKFVQIGPLQVYFKDLIEHTKESWDLLGNYQDTISALHDSYVSFTNFHTNQIIKTLTIFSVIMFPLSFIVGIFGMNVEEMPIVGGPNGFWAIMGTLLFVLLVMLGVFRFKRWL